MKTTIKNLYLAAAVVAGLIVQPAFAAPISVISGPNQVTAGQVISLNAFMSYDTSPVATIVNYAWDADFDGQYDDFMGVTIKLTVDNNALIGRVYQVGLRTTNNLGQWSSAVHSLEVVKELPASDVPEPTSVALLGISIAMLAIARRRKARG